MGIVFSGSPGGALYSAAYAPSVADAWYANLDKQIVDNNPELLVNREYCKDTCTKIFPAGRDNSDYYGICYRLCINTPSKFNANTTLADIKKMLDELKDKGATNMKLILVGLAGVTIFVAVKFIE